jgi:hypothetical protein
MDVEGFEVDAIEGSMQVPQRLVFNCFLSICSRRAAPSQSFGIQHPHRDQITR